MDTCEWPTLGAPYVGMRAASEGAALDGNTRQTSAASFAAPSTTAAEVSKLRPPLSAHPRRPSSGSYTHREKTSQIRQQDKSSRLGRSIM